MFGADIFQRFCTNLHLREKVMNKFLHFVAAITFFCMSAKHNVSGQSTFYTTLKTLEKSTHFMLTHVHHSLISVQVVLVYIYTLLVLNYSFSSTCT